MLKNDETITALATPSGEGAISVIRVSGPDSFKITDKIFRGKKSIGRSEGHKIHYGKIIDESKEVIDDVLVSVFKEPNSYTGEDSVEISTHGSPLVVRNIISLLIKYGAVLAEPGQFTKRAYLNGKLDLIQAEAVADLIHSRTEASLRGARNQLDGILSGKVEFLREKLINTSSLIELELDFSEEDVDFVSTEKLRKEITGIIEEINVLLESYAFGRVIRDGVNVAVVGKPNVGKSSLLNYLLKEARAIVTDIPGTTRDVLREEISIDGVLFKIYDTAGIRITEDLIEKEGVLRSRETVKSADLVIFLNETVSDYASEVNEELLGLIEPERIIRLANKIDLEREVKFPADIAVSALTGEGIDDLLELLKEKAIGSRSYTEKTAVVNNVRHLSALEKARLHLNKALDTITGKLSGEFIAVDLRSAGEALGEIIGAVTTDDILNNIFSKFCIGK